MMVFALHQYESAVGKRVPSIPNPSPTSFPTPALQAVTEHQLCVPHVIHQTPPDSLFTYSNVCFDGITSNHPTFSFFH